ncbi:39S ribosomal protein L33, mitochondrial [Nilaparvata lugens]|uniref:39S ribosomal protein L33, mitochondrial n=1 Tax=Nilaparvata lugens TaxID=108931 RepID=UPI000B98CDAE|nr:39S ribosomal protein L33, mitochondrial [Nilaparvata lugens]
MFLTNVLLAKKAKAKHILVLMESMVSGHQFMTARERLGEKLELLHYDPYINTTSVYKERKKIKSLSPKFVMDPKIQKMLGLDIDEEIKKVQT